MEGWRSTLGRTTRRRRARTVASMSSDTDLYPPDLEVVTPEARDARNRAMVGTFLVVMGTGILLERTFSNDLDVFWLAIGLSLLVGWAQAPRFLMFAVGSIMTGFAAGGFLDSLVSLPFQGSFETLLASAGFLAVYVRYPLRARWALVPAGICAVVAVAEAGVEFIGFIPAAITGMMLPLLLIAGGALLLMRHALPPRIVRVGLIVIAVAFVASAASSVDRWDLGDGHDFGPPVLFGSHQFTERIGDLGNRTLVVETESGHIEVVTGTTDEVFVTAIASRNPRPGGGIEIDESDDEVQLLFRRDIAASWKLTVPPGTDLDLTTESGLVNLVHDGGDVNVDTDSGMVQATLRDDGGSLAIATESGLVQINGSGQLSPSIAATSDDGNILVDGTTHSEEYNRTGPGTDIAIETDSGQIIVVGLAA